MKRIFSMLLTVALVIGILPAGWMGSASAAGTFFIFPDQSYDMNLPKIVTTERVTFKGSINGVSSNSISYSVVQLSNGVATNNKSENLRTGLSFAGSNITVTDLKLYSGLNKITFFSNQNSSNMQDVIYIEYQDGPKLSNLTATLGDQTEALPEGITTVLVDENNTGTDDVRVIIRGTATNATSVTLSSDKSNTTYNVSSANNYLFTGSVTLAPGSNKITIKAFNATQNVVANREITIYTGNPEFYGVVLQRDGNTSADLSTSPDFTVSADSGIQITGKVLVPTGGTFPVVDHVIGTFSNADMTSTEVDMSVTDAGVTGAYRAYTFTGTVPAGFGFDKSRRVALAVEYTDATISSATPLHFTLRNSTVPYIYSVNYLPDFNSQLLTRISNNDNAAINTAKTLTGTSMKDTTTDVQSLPVGMEFIIVNGTGDPQLSPVSGFTGSLVVPASLKSTETRVINGKSTSVQKVIGYLATLPKEGTNNLSFYVGSDPTKTVDATVNLLYGPFAKFNSIYDGQRIELDTSKGNTDTAKLTAMGNFAGQLLNIPSSSSVVYTGTNKNLFLYINNVEVELKSVSGNSFELNNTDSAKAAGALNLGNNEIKLVYRSANGSYENTINVVFAQTNIPIIPFPGTQGILPYTAVSGLGSVPEYKDIAPKTTDKNFIKVNDNQYTTSQGTMNVFGTFQLVDLGNKEADVQSEVNAVTNRNNYILKIAASNGETTTWTLDNEFISANNKTFVYNGNKDVRNLLVYYHPDKKYFSFILRNQEIPKDGSPVVYNISLFNNGESGQSATFRLQVSGQTTGFNLLRPLPEKRILNQNFVEVVVDAGSAESVVVNKVAAEQTGFDDNFDGVLEYPSAWKAIVTGLKANTDTKITVTVTTGGEKVDQTFTVRYVPTNIPGAQYMEAMKTSHKIFDGDLTLAFTRGTSLIRRDYDLPQQFKNQVFAGHTLYFAIANSTDGVVDRHEFELDRNGNEIADMENIISAGSGFFGRGFPDKFIKSSPVYWIDPGTADDINTTDAYDPVKYGSDPYQLLDNPKLSTKPQIRSFYNRDARNELVPSKTATLTLKYDSSVAEDAGKGITVFRFDPDINAWQNIGGVVDSKKNTVKVPLDRFGYYVVGKVGESYSDIIGHSYAREFLETMYAKGVMNPVDPVNRFGPDIYISRGEFTAMIVKGLQLPLNYSGTKHFDDVSSSLTSVSPTALYDFRYIETAARAGIVKGSQPRTFGPENPITRQDAAVIIAKALDLKLETNRDKVTKDLTKYFKDASSIDYYAQPSVLAIAKKGFIAGSPIDASDPKAGANFNPTALTLRGDAAIIMARVMIDKKLLPKM
ncbi:S-layer homology domain-containing protein [Paenibacillus massiliensis]|uniref:S-layer homology domain-containing protein n=1 Tax=Paenibacillus massiliensis TaxID=225917 RepID=UPI000472DB86|nr:S-layer homology domain-containing protein [Paenibacillus massiliensis]